MLKTCKTCGETRPLDAFHKKPRGVHGRAPHCRDCANAKRRRYRTTYGNYTKSLRVQEETHAMLAVLAAGSKRTLNDTADRLIRAAYRQVTGNDRLITPEEVRP